MLRTKGSYKSVRPDDRDERFLNVMGVKSGYIKHSP